ncbi:Phycobilisome protein [Leptolyngbyaceae cyanobacterium JSC-12]|nr:Phycobilisome protein [Leptolyngbyaceae cyanobacterium JSC-12]
MQDTLTRVINRYDVTDRFLDNAAIATLTEFLETGSLRVQVVAVINANAVEIVRESARQLFEELPYLIQPGGNAYTTRRHSMYLRDMDYFLRYSSYALLTGDTSILDERLLAGLKDTFNSLGIPLGVTARSVQLMKERTHQKLIEAQLGNPAFVDEPFDYIIRALSERNV